MLMDGIMMKQTHVVKIPFPFLWPSPRLGPIHACPSMHQLSHPLTQRSVSNARKPLRYFLCVGIPVTQKTVMIVQEAGKMVFVAHIVVFNSLDSNDFSEGRF